MAALTAQTSSVQEQLDAKATRDELSAAIRDEREIVIMPLFRQQALLQEEENKRVSQSVSVSSVKWVLMFTGCSLIVLRLVL